MLFIFSFNTILLAKSAKRIALLPTLSSYAGPIPLPVVPILLGPFLSSLISSIFL